MSFKIIWNTTTFWRRPARFKYQWRGLYFRVPPLDNVATFYITAPVLPTQGLTPPLISWLYTIDFISIFYLLSKPLVLERTKGECNDDYDFSTEFSHQSLRKLFKSNLTFINRINKDEVNILQWWVVLRVSVPNYDSLYTRLTNWGGPCLCLSLISCPGATELPFIFFPLSSACTTEPVWKRLAEVSLFLFCFPL